MERSHSCLADLFFFFLSPRRVHYYTHRGTNKPPHTTTILQHVILPWLRCYQATTAPPSGDDYQAQNLVPSTACAVYILPINSSKLRPTVGITLHVTRKIRQEETSLRERRHDMRVARHFLRAGHLSVSPLPLSSQKKKKEADGNTTDIMSS